MIIIVIIIIVIIINIVVTVIIFSIETTFCYAFCGKIWAVFRLLRHLIQ